MQNGQVAAAVSAIREKTVLSGNRLERNDLSVRQYSDDADEPTNEELRD